MNETCVASVFLTSTACDSDVTRSWIICSRINIYMTITEHSFSYIFTFPTEALVTRQYEWLGHLQPEIIHTHNIPRRKSYYAAVIRLVSTFYKPAYPLLYRQSVCIVQTVQHPQVRPVDTEPSTFMRGPMEHTVHKCFKRLHVNVKKQHRIYILLRVNQGNRVICSNETVLKTFTLR